MHFSRPLQLVRTNCQSSSRVILCPFLYCFLVFWVVLTVSLWCQEHLQISFCQFSQIRCYCFLIVFSVLFFRMNSVFRSIDLLCLLVLTSHLRSASLLARQNFHHKLYHFDYKWAQKTWEPENFICYIKIELIYHTKIKLLIQFVRYRVKRSAYLKRKYFLLLKFK